MLLALVIWDLQYLSIVFVSDNDIKEQLDEYLHYEQATFEVKLGVDLWKLPFSFSISIRFLIIN
jgi:hypothetical protein